jgi:hypothetical protein
MALSLHDRLAKTTIHRLQRGYLNFYERTVSSMRNTVLRNLSILRVVQYHLRLENVDQGEGLAKPARVWKRSLRYRWSLVRDDMAIERSYFSRLRKIGKLWRGSCLGSCDFSLTVPDG